MKFILITDTHIGGKNFQGFAQQPNYPEQAEELLAALSGAIREHKAEFVIHAGDMTNTGSEEDIRDAVRLFSALPVPVFLTPGNHDCMMPDPDRLWLENAPGFFPERTMDNTFVRGGLRFDLLCNFWGKDGRRQWNGAVLAPGLHGDQIERLREGDPSIPRVIVFHSQIRAAHPRQTGMKEEFHVPHNGFDVVGTALIREFHPLLIAGGHNHLNQCERIGGTYAVTASSLCETPFEYKLAEYADGVLHMKTLSLADRLSFPADYREERTFIQGAPCDREF